MSRIISILFYRKANRLKLKTISSVPISRVSHLTPVKSPGAYGTSTNISSLKIYAYELQNYQQMTHVAWPFLPTPKTKSQTNSLVNCPARQYLSLHKSDLSLLPFISVHQYLSCTATLVKEFTTIPTAPSLRLTPTDTIC